MAIPENHFEGNGELAKAGNAIDKIAGEPQELPGQVLDAAKSEIMKQVDKFRRARKQERQFNKALAVVKKHGDEIQSKLAA